MHLPFLHRFTRFLSTQPGRHPRRLTLQRSLRACAVCLMAAATPAHAQGDASRQDVYLETMFLIANGHKQEASEALARIIQDEPEHAGAWLDLALLQCEMGRADEAEQLFAEIVARFQPPPVIIEIITKKRAQGCGVAPHPGRLSFLLGRGFDDNVNQGASTPNFSIGSGSTLIELQLLPEFLPRRDQFTFIAFDYAGTLNTHGTTGFVQLQARVNDELSRFNTGLLAVGAEHPWQAGNWRMRGTGTLAALSLGGALYQTQGRLQVQASPPWSLPEGLRLDLTAGVANVAYPTQSSFDATTWEMRGLLNYSTRQTKLQATLGVAFDQATADRPGGDRHGWSAGIQGSTRLAHSIFGELGWSRQTWRSESAYSPGLIDQARNQTTDTLRAGLIVPLTAQQAVNIELRQVWNRENVSVFEYDNRQLLLSWQWRN